MHFSSDINRPPYEALSAQLQVTSGCSHAKCTFCNFYKDHRYEQSPLEEIAADLEEAQRFFFNPKRFFLQAADAFSLDTERLLKIADMIRAAFPTVKTIGGYARVDNLEDKSIDDLRRLAEAGYGDFYFGVESGDDVILERMRKGYDAAYVLSQVSKMDEAGMPYIFSFINGIGGHDYGFDHARKTAKLYNRLHPTMIYGSALTLMPRTVLDVQARKGVFIEATEVEKLRELQEFARCLEVPTVFRFEHVSVAVPVSGRIPEDKDVVIARLQETIDHVDESELLRYRESIVNL